MANQRGIVHPNLMSALGGFYPSLCTIQAATETQSATGAVQQGWADAPGLVGLRCRLAPAPNSANREVRAEAGTYGEFNYTVALAGYYPAITEQSRAVVDGTAYDVQSVAHDGNHTTTEMFVRLAR
jgi:hypothetical protein